MTAMLKVFTVNYDPFPFSDDKSCESALTSGADSKVLTNTIVFSVFAFGQFAYSAQPRNFVAVSSKVIGFAGLPFAKSA